VLERAWELVRCNRGAAGIDRITMAQIEQHGVDRLLDELAADLRAGNYRASGFHREARQHRAAAAVDSRGS
jgi:RNA-directed DNA polymerase